jgi:Rrf2 family protein
MRISMRADYGARAMIDLSQRYGQGLTQTADIAARQHIPESYLEQLLAALRKAGLVRSVRGPAGGHELSRPAQELTLGDVLDVLEGVTTPSSCMDDNGACTVSGTCVLQDVWCELAESYRKLVHSITFESLAQRQADREARNMYYI